MEKKLKIELEYTRITLIDKVLEALERAIFSGKILPGEHLSEARLAKELGISRVPVREALIRLEDAKIVQKTHRGRKVAKISRQDLRELYEIKNLLEIHAATNGSNSADKSIIKNLYDLVNRMDKLLNPQDYINLQKTNHQFHNLLVSSLGNKRLFETYLNAAKQIRWTTHISLSRPGHPKHANREHRKIFEAFESSDSMLLSDLINEHNQKALELVLKSFKY